MGKESMLIINIKELWLHSTSPVPLLKGQAMSMISPMKEAYIWIEGEQIKEFGLMAQCPSINVPKYDANQGTVIPSFVDCHTHLVFAQWREQEFVDRIKGLSYQEISARGGGILNSADKIKSMTEDALFEKSLSLVHNAIKNGTGAMEIKSGYGLNPTEEIKILRVIKRLKKAVPIPIKATFLGAHSYPLKNRENHQGYIDELIHQMLPQIAEEELADYCDVFCEQGFFSPDETDQILTAASKFNIRSRIHTNQFTHSGGIDIGIRHQSLSVDHLEVLNDEEIELLKDSSTIPVVLPTAAFFMNLHYPPARKMIEQGLGIAIASDFNPGTSPSYNLTMAWSLACIKMRLLPEEALVGMTINAAHALEMAHEVGSITPGKKANLIITNHIPSLGYIPYSLTAPWIQQVCINGQFIS
ncbi:MAG: imidazolonepropionase [Saprospiraceae bacterium]|jgi:imidazolonepropionase|nr:imidazolonepropionase [Saprospiraceae bacterium]